PGAAAPWRPVVADGPVAVQLDEILEYQVHIVHRLGPALVPGHQDGLPRGQAAVDLLLEADQLAANAADLLDAAHLPVRAGLQAREEVLHLVDFLLERPP